MSDSANMLEPAFDIGEIDEDFDPAVPPATGVEYLQRVVLEARNYDEIAVAEVDRSRFKKQTVNYPGVEACPSAPSHLLPSLEWQQCQIANFSKLRQEVARRKASCVIKCSYELPLITNEKAWYRLCFGCEMQIVDKEEVPGEGLKPLVSVVLPMSQSVVEQLLEYHVDWLESRSELCHLQGQWIFALMACLQLPLTPETCSMLRTLARKCQLIRAAAEETSDADAVAPLNLFICLVARYFRQMDLADP